MGTNSRRPGILLIDKPAGFTSFQTLGPLKKQLGTKKIGHSGTLDKFASGLMVVLVNRATKLVPLFTGMDKTYRATICFGQQTDTLDPEGRVVDTGPLLNPHIISTTLDSIVDSFLGEQNQIPPVYSAIHVDGKRAYERTLQGEDLNLKPRKITIRNLQIHSATPEALDISIECSKGTYIRSLARDISRALGTCGYLSALRRLRVGPFLVDQGVDPNNFDPLMHCKTGHALAALVPESGTFEVSKKYLGVLKNGALTGELFQGLKEFKNEHPQLHRVFLFDHEEVLGLVSLEALPSIEWIVGA